MATLLLILIYIAFVGLGIPDSLFGTAWPAIYPEFGLPVSAAGGVALLVSGCTVASSLVSARVIHRLGTAKVTAISTIMTAAALLGFSFSNGIGWFCLLAVPLGLGAGAIDSALNNYVALHYKASHMNFLHCAYGVGVSLSPYLMSLFLTGAGGWRTGYRAAFVIQSVIALLTVIALPLWGRAHPPALEDEAQATSKTVSLAGLVRIPGVPIVWLMFISSCAIEYTCGAWGSTFLVGAKAMPVEQAAEAITFYYLGMTLGRFLSGVLSVKLSSWKLIYMGMGVVLGAIGLLLLPLPPVIAGGALFFIGLGNGPVFPNLIHLTPRNFGSDVSQSVMGSQMAAAYIGVMLIPPIFGFLAQTVGAGIFPYFLLVLFAVMTSAAVAMRRVLQRARLPSFDKRKQD